MTSRGTFLSAIVATALTGCAASDDRVGQFLIRPDRYVLYNCTQLAKVAQATVSRQRKLEMLMAKAGNGFRWWCWSAATFTGRNMRSCAV